MDGLDDSTWWKRCYEGLRGARFVHLFCEFHWTVWCWVVLCFVVCVGCLDFACSVLGWARIMEKKY